jgi:hypothetical protein
MAEHEPIHYEKTDATGKALKLADVHFDASKETFNENAERNKVLKKAFEDKADKIKGILDLAKAEAYRDFVKTQFSLGERWIARPDKYNRVMEDYQSNMNQIYQESLKEMDSTLTTMGLYRPESLDRNFDVMLRQMANAYMKTKLEGKLRAKNDVRVDEPKEVPPAPAPAPDDRAGSTVTENIIKDASGVRTKEAIAKNDAVAK